MARKNKGKGGGNPNRPRFWGKHAVAAALDNPERRVLKAVHAATREDLARLERRVAKLETNSARSPQPVGAGGDRAA